LLTGDISSEVETQLKINSCQVLKVAHHGSKTATSREFLKKVRPKLAVISVGKDRFGHPSDEVLKRLKILGIKTLRTDKNGEIEIVTDGDSKKMKIKTKTK
jgi:competence protein ComEC